MTGCGSVRVGWMKCFDREVNGDKRHGEHNASMEKGTTASTDRQCKEGSEERRGERSGEVG